MREIIYILTNEAMPGWIKIGITTTSVEQRMLELDRTGVPLPFQCFYAAAVNNSQALERKIHFIFGEPGQRARPNREFFRVDPERVRVAIEMVAIEDITSQVNTEFSKEDTQALIDNERRQPFRFSLAKVPVGAVLQFTRDESKTCRVIDDKYVDFEGQKMSLSRVALLLLKKMGYKSPQVQGPLYWSYEGDSLVERRLRFEEEENFTE
jgi:hypothetical protein